MKNEKQTDNGLRQSRDGSLMARRIDRGQWKAWHRVSGKVMACGTLRDLRLLGF